MPKANSIAHIPQANGHAPGKDAPRSLPAQVTPFIGRQREVAGVRELLHDAGVRLLNLTGPPGIGKTRLAVQVAAGVAGRFPGGVYFVSLAAVTRPEGIVAHLAQALGLREMSNQPLLQRLQEHLADKQTLLVLDNLEQIEGPAATIGSLLAACPRLKMLATSRTRLQVYGEHEYRVPALGLPDAERLPNLQSLSKVEAVALFVQRAQAARADFRLTEANAEAVARLCVGLDGLPLAIELAAARTRTLSPQAMLSRLHHRLDLLGGGPRDLPARHQTLREAIAWSYDLLTPEEQQLFRRLAVFSGGATIEATRHVAGERDGGHTASACGEALVESLHDKSLLAQPAQGEQAEAEARFSMLETVREYAWERLAESGELEAARKAHALYYEALADMRTEVVVSPAGKALLERLEREYDNVRAALAWCANTQDPEGTDIGMRLAGGMSLFWDIRGYLKEQYEQVMAMLSKAEQATDRHALARLLIAAARSVTLLGIEVVGKSYLEESLALSREAGEKHAIVVALSALGHAAVHLDDLALAESCFEECLALHAESGDTCGLATILSKQADLALHGGDIAGARVKFEEALAVARDVYAPMLLADLLIYTGYVSAEEGEYEQAIENVSQAIEMVREMEAVQTIAYAVGVLGKVAYVQGQHEQAVRLYAAASTLFDRCGLPLEPPLHTDPAEYRRYLEELSGTLGDKTFAAAWERGRKLGVPEVLAELRNAPAQSAPETAQPQPGVPNASALPAGLTPREVEVLRLVASGMTNSEAASALTVSPHTINMHLRSIFSKLGVTSRSAATRFALINGLV
ncbi:MAG TPA: LuxR C-terminal-related transcriptional regulator [Chloroflexia bacterium]|nr:LuxR C-terminal-related transcriptional regulator [Chloroflexia bacterium]